MYQLLARMITFRQNIGQLLAAVRKHLPDASQPKVYNKLSVLLQHASRGIHANATASPQDLMVFIHGVLDGGLAGEEAAREAAQAEATAAVHTSGECSYCAPAEVILYTMHSHGCLYSCHQCSSGSLFTMVCQCHVATLALITLAGYASYDTGRCELQVKMQNQNPNRQVSMTTC